jgi:hypothetical protein
MKEAWGLTRTTLTDQLKAAVEAHELEAKQARLELKYAKEDAENAIARLNKQVRTRCRRATNIYMIMCTRTASLLQVKEHLASVG